MSGEASPNTTREPTPVDGWDSKAGLTFELCADGKTAKNRPSTRVPGYALEVPLGIEPGNKLTGSGVPE